MTKPVRDRFDDVPRSTGRVGAHRAENPRMNRWAVLLWSVVAVLVLAIGGIFASMVIMGKVTLFPEAVPTIEPTPERTGVVDTSYTVLVLNATPEQGLDVDVRDTLLNNGWTAGAVFAGPAGSQDFPETTVYFVHAEDEEAAIGLARLIGGAAVAQSDVNADPSDPGQRQLTVVIGLDRAPAPAATPAS